jgi:hypothetical protein
MANATTLAVTALTTNSTTADPTADSLDTGSVAVTLPASVGGETDRVIIRVVNTAAANLTVTVVAGDNPPAFRAGMGALTSGTIAQNGILWLGPFESARFIQNDGKLNVTFTPASGTIACSAQCFKLPKA